jgi:hypothetical protein
MGFFAMLAEEYMLVDISLSAASWCDFSLQHQWVYLAPAILFIFSYRAEESRNASTAASPDTLAVIVKRQ